MLSGSSPSASELFQLIFVLGNPIFHFSTSFAMVWDPPATVHQKVPTLPVEDGCANWRSAEKIGRPSNLFLW